VSGKILKVLVVDDTEANLSLFDKFIRRMGHETVFATNGWRRWRDSRNAGRIWC